MSEKVSPDRESFSLTYMCKVQWIVVEDRRLGKDKIDYVNYLTSLQVQVI